MQRLVSIVFIIYVINGCAVKKEMASEGDYSHDRKSKNITYRSIIENNVTNHSFFISKLSIEIIESGKRERFLGNINYKSEDTILISLRAISGLEAARIYINNDSVFINDRIRKEFIRGTEEMVFKKYGIFKEIIAIALGDFVTQNGSSNDLINCENSRDSLTISLKGRKIDYMVDCYERKVKSVTVSGNNSYDKVRIIFEKFRVKNKAKYPEKVYLKGFGNIPEISISIESIEVPWRGNIKFTRARNYELVEIK